MLGQGIQDSPMTLLTGLVISNIYLNIFGNINQFSAVKITNPETLMKSGIETVLCPGFCNLRYFQPPEGITINQNITVTNYSVKYAYFLEPGIYENFKYIQDFKNLKIFAPLAKFTPRYQFGMHRINANSFFKKDLNEHILLAYSSGLVKKWKMDDALIYFKKGKTINRFEIVDVDLCVTYDQAVLKEFQIPFGLYVSGMTISLMIFFCEMLKKYLF